MAKFDKWLNSIGILVGIYALYSIGMFFRETCSLPIYNPVRQSLKNQFKEDYKTEVTFTRERRVFEDGEVIGIVQGEIAGYPNIEYSDPERIICKKKGQPLLEGLTEEGFCRIVDSYNGPIDYAALTRYVKDKKNKLIEERGK